MFSTSTTATLLAAFISFAPAALGAKIVPCTAGAGPDNGCAFCSDDKGIELTPWSQATADPTFDLPNAAAKEGGGWNVWWNVEQPDEGCRVILTSPYTTDRGSFDSRLSGNVILSVGHGGCYFAHVGNGGVAASFCCGNGDCTAAGAIDQLSKREEKAPVVSTPKVPSRIMRATRPDAEKRGWGGGGKPAAPAPPPAAVTCSAPTPNGETYTKAGPQQIDGQSLNCNGGKSCSISPVMSVAVGSSVMNEKSTTITDSTGVSLSVTAGFMFIGPTATATGTVSKDWSNAVTNAVAQTDTNTVTKSLTLDIGLIPGANFNVWFTPLLNCQSFTINCNGVDQSIEKCTPALEENGDPKGDHGVVTIG